MRLQVRVDQTDLDRIAGRLGVYKKSTVATARRQTVNRVAQRVRTRTRRELAAAKRVKQKDISRQIRSYPATAKRPAAKVWIGLRKTVPAEAGKAALPHTPFVVVRLGAKKKWVREPGGQKRSHGRPVTSSPNLPIVRAETVTRVVLQPEAGQILEATSRGQMRTFFGPEFKRQLARRKTRV